MMIIISGFHILLPIEWVKMLKVGIVGCGNIGNAFIMGLKNNCELYVYNRTLSKMDKYDFINKCSTSIDLINSVDIIILCLKPNQYEEWLKNNDIKGKLLISVAAGINSEFLEKYVKNFVITMPNVLSEINIGYNVIVDSKFNEKIIDIFKYLGDYSIIKETELKTYILLAGSSPAYFYQIIDNLASATIEYNIDYELAVNIYASVMKSSADMILKSKNSPQQLVQNVCSPGGITTEIITVLKSDKSKHIISHALANGYKKAVEMEGNEITNR